MTTPRARPAHDPTLLRGIAHPMRRRILQEIDATGPTRAADIARDLGIPANQASFHLRQLAKYGLVVEAPELARDKRDRVWKLVAEEGLSLDMGELEKQPGGKAAVTVFRRQASAWAHEVVEAAYSSRRPKDTLQSVTERSIRLTREEARELTAELDAVAMRWAERTRSREPDRRTYLLFSVLQPYPETKAPPQ